MDETEALRMRHDDSHTEHHGCGGMNHMMSMNFHFGTSETVLFSFWKFSTTEGLIGSVIGIFILSVLYECLKYYREYLFRRSASLSKDSKSAKTSVFSLDHGLQTVLHAFQIVVSYFLMLIFMTYNTWLAAAVVLGSTLGYFLFGWKKSVIVDVSEHCN